MAGTAPVSGNNPVTRSDILTPPICATVPLRIPPSALDMFLAMTPSPTAPPPAPLFVYTLFMNYGGIVAGILITAGRFIIGLTFWKCNGAYNIYSDFHKVLLFKTSVNYGYIGYACVNVGTSNKLYNFTLLSAEQYLTF